MKKSDIAMIILIASLSMLVAYFAAKAVLGDPNTESVTVKTVDAISADVTEPDAQVFNDDAINPTVEIIIGENESAGGQ
jgi:hypothetical protein